ncbi:peroxisomal 2,4-dienoyl-CoA reductase [(3E)-enoyl-CoA-producing] isoform X1 [Physcomitrium patens]|uniref:2,4-dienoyl-CoA reductase [(3E)-enoyl-CoA-producing] n=2 Tax=Physcomitrium patens TaxID=3218 RepID=A9S0U3_PHYPA|nr:peroxisomal 2,4-dienoyl-CoA reductase-like isoform X1 [Physcomitrium patens]PNR33486.1 hypothetical protein PHYPA_025430 [Physcomitrium patens]|eukprot:XP_024356925.1 peroxisomal 2,4-dienoyl-CoA reductase-like isoform X1 [Physcomitrella patens]
MADESPFRNTVLKGKVALITGGGSGICFEIATQFGLHGAMVAIMGRRKHVLDAAVASLESLGIRAVGVQGDVRKKEDASRVVETVVEELGRLDILINGAAGNFLSAAEDLSPNGFKTVMDIDTVGTFTMSHAAVNYLKQGGKGKGPNEGGVIISISATLHYSANWYQIHVSAAKAAVDSLTRSLALEWGTDYKIRCNGIAPGPISGTPGMEKLNPEEAGISSGDAVPLGKMGEKWDIAMAAIFLASESGKYINGAVLPVDGGSWLAKPRYISKEQLRQFGRAVEQRSRSKTQLPNSKL